MQAPLKILIVANEADHAVVRHILEASGLAVDVVEAADGASGLLVLRGQTVDCALVDYRLPDCDGPQLLREARSSGRAVPSILLIEPGDEAVADETFREGADESLSKARLTGDLLAHAIRYVVRLHRAQIEAAEVRAVVQDREREYRFNAERAEQRLRDEKRASESLHEALCASEKQYRYLAESLPQMVWTALPNGQCDYLSQQWVNYTGISEADQLGYAWLKVLHPDDRENTSRIWNDAVNGRGKYDLEYRIRRHDGVYRWFKTRGVPVSEEGPLRQALDEPMNQSPLIQSEGTDSPGVDGRAAQSSRRGLSAEAGPAGRIVKWFGTCTDIDDQKRAEQELQEAKEQAEAARESAEAANAAKDQFLAVLSHELRTPLTPVLTTVQSLEADADLSPELRGPIEMIRRNVELEARLIDDLLDLTRIAKNKLELNLQTIDAHEALGSALEICGEDIRAGRLSLEIDLQATRHHVMADSARMHQVFWNLIKNAVKFTPEGGRITIRTINDRITGSGSGTAEAGGGDGAASSRRPALRPTSPLFPTTPLSASPRATSPRLIVEVRDTGIGIDAKVLPRIFEAFEQGERQITRRFGGLGLGLAISKVLVDMQGGRLTADSAGLGRGSVFAVDLATVEPAKPRKLAIADAPAGRSGSMISDRGERARVGAEQAGSSSGATLPNRRTPGLRILLVDDHEDTTRAMSRLLQTWGHTVSTANTVGSALETFRKSQDLPDVPADKPAGTSGPADPSAAFDLLISDIGLPDGNGLELIRQLHQMYPQEPVRGIALSGFGMEEDVKKSREAGFFAHLTKPIDFRKLQAVIRQATAG